MEPVLKTIDWKNQELPSSEQIKEFIRVSFEISRKRSKILEEIKKAILAEDKENVFSLASQLVNLKK